MKFLVDRCAGRQLSTWLRHQGHDVLEARDLGEDPGDRALLEHASAGPPKGGHPERVAPRQHEGASLSGW